MWTPYVRNVGIVEVGLILNPLEVDEAGKEHKVAMVATDHPPVVWIANTISIQTE